MMSKAEFRESSILRNLQEASEARGMRFYVNPPRDVVPEFLGDFQPDAIARGPEGGMIVEVKHRRSPGSEKQLAEIARRVSGQKGWEFRTIYLSSPVDEEAPIAKPTPQQLQNAFREIEALMRGGHSAAAFVAVWAALESVARLASADSRARSAESLSPLQVIQTLAEEGHIENDAADRLRQMTKLRNAIVHGDLSVNVPAEQVKHVLKDLRAIASGVEAALVSDASESR